MINRIVTLKDITRAQKYKEMIDSNNPDKIQRFVSKTAWIGYLMEEVVAKWLAENRVKYTRIASTSVPGKYDLTINNQRIDVKGSIGSLRLNRSQFFSAKGKIDKFLFCEYIPSKFTVCIEGYLSIDEVPKNRTVKHNNGAHVHATHFSISRKNLHSPEDLLKEAFQ